MSTPNFERAKRAAAELAGRVTALPIDVEAIAKEKGVDITRTTFGKFASEISGLCALEDGKIYVNKDDTPIRQRYTIAHELGHWVLHQNENYTVLPRFLDSPEIPVEQEANCFAEHLLIPDDALAVVTAFLGLGENTPAAGNAVVSKTMMASILGVSQKVLEKRLKDAGRV